MTLKEKIIFGAVVVVVAIIAGGLWSSYAAPSFGGIGLKNIEQYNPYVKYNGGLRTALPIAASSTLQVTGAAHLYGAATLGSGLTLTTSNTATSTATIGCIQTYATSTATPVALQLGVAHEATTTFSGTGYGIVAWQFGSCPL